MLGQVLVLVLLLLFAEPGTTGLLLLFGLFHRYACNTPGKSICAVRLNGLMWCLRTVWLYIIDIKDMICTHRQIYFSFWLLNAHMYKPGLYIWVELSCLNVVVKLFLSSCGTLVVHLSTIIEAPGWNPCRWVRLCVAILANVISCLQSISQL